jgi:hypothetical protein
MSTGSRRVQFAVAETPCVVQFSIISERGWRNSIVGKQIIFSGGAKIAGASRSQITSRSMTTSHFEVATCSGVKILERDEIQTTVLWGGYMAEDGAFRAEKQCGYKLLLTALKSRAHLVSYPRTTCGFSLVIRACPDPEEDSTNEPKLTLWSQNHMLIQHQIRE